MTYRKLIFLASLMPLFLYGTLLEERVKQDLAYSNIILDFPQESTLLDVAIIGAGHAGKGLCLALLKQGIHNIAIFESAPKGAESFWLTTARMKTLRSKKNCVGPSLFVPHLTFQAWYEAQGGTWEDITKIPTSLWGEYLLWFGEVLHLPISYQRNLNAIKVDEKNNLQLIFDSGPVVRTKKVILATGRDSFGGINIPSLVKEIPKSLWYHTNEKFDSSIFSKKNVCIIGAAASAFDLAATALEAGALKVDMLMRRPEVKTINYLARHFQHWLSYYYLSDKEKVNLLHNAYQHGFCPPLEAVERVLPYKQFHLHSNTNASYCSWTDTSITIHTNETAITADLLFVATGFKCDPFLVQPITSFVDKILLWRDKVEDTPLYLGLFPYLGKSFEFLEKEIGSAPYLKNIHCFNFGSYLSHGNTGIDIDQFHIGAERIAEGIASDFMLEEYYLQTP